VNYYERHLGDYARDTAHLSLLEHGVYTLLLDRYYATEQPIPADQVHRVARARSRDEKAAVDAVLAEFFTLADGAYRNKRADKVIADYLDAEPEREAKKENGKERVRRHRERRKAMFETLRDNGVVPDWNASTEQLESELKRVQTKKVTRYETADVTPVTRYETANQTPDTSNTPERLLHTDKSRSACENENAPVATAAGAACLAMRQAGLVSTNPAHPELLALLPHASPEMFAQAAAVAVSKGKGFGYALGVLKGQIADAQAPPPAARAGPAPPAAVGKQMQGIMALEQMKRGNLAEKRNPDGPATAGLLVAGQDTGGGNAAGYGAGVD
jgi:uncharacterized protein YdaU (DUF1376 family)